LLSVKNAAYKICPYCEGVAGEGDNPDPWLSGYFLASNSRFADPSGQDLGTVHVLKDITERKRAEEKYRTLVSNVQERVFIATPQGRFLDFNDALLRMSGYETREELLAIDIPSGFYKNAADRERLQRLLQEHGAVADFEFEMRRKDGEARTMLETSFTVRDAAGNATAYQGFLQDITERKEAHATFISAQGLPLAVVFRDAQIKEGIATAYIVILWSKDRVIGGLVVGTRTPREFSPADVNLLIAVGSQISSAIDRSILYEETRQAYENLRRTQEQLLHSERLAAVGQLISGVAHELNNPLTAILGYSQLLTSSGQL